MVQLIGVGVCEDTNEGRDSDLLKLPIGLKKQFGNTTADVGVLSAQFFPEYTEITACNCF